MFSYLPHISYITNSIHSSQTDHNMDSLCTCTQDLGSTHTECEDPDYAEDGEEICEEEQLSDPSDNLSINSEASSTSCEISAEFGRKIEGYVAMTTSVMIGGLDLVLLGVEKNQRTVPVLDWPKGCLEARKHDYLAEEIDKSPFSRAPQDSYVCKKDLKTVEETRSEDEKLYLHHLNFHNQPVYHKSATPPEVSFWLIMTETIPKPQYSRFCRELVTVSQAGKLIDPVYYQGPEELMKFRGNTLRDAVTGYFDKAYQPVGTWGRDYYSSDEVVPVCTASLNDWLDGKYNNGPPRGYIVGSYDGNLVVNDDGRTHSTKRVSKTPIGRSHLCIVRNVDDEDL